jgi:hypothetical protein
VPFVDVTEARNSVLSSALALLFHVGGECIDSMEKMARQKMKAIQHQIFGRCMRQDKALLC